MKLRVVAGISSIEFDYRLGGVRAVSHPAAGSWRGRRRARRRPWPLMPHAAGRGRAGSRVCRTKRGPIPTSVRSGESPLPGGVRRPAPWAEVGGRRRHRRGVRLSSNKGALMLDYSGSRRAGLSGGPCAPPDAHDSRRGPAPLCGAALASPPRRFGAHRRPVAGLEGDGVPGCQSTASGLTSGRRDSFPPVGIPTRASPSMEWTHVAFLTGSGWRRPRQLFLA